MRACGYDRMFAEDVILRTYGCELTYAAEQAPNGLLLCSLTADVILSTDMIKHMTHCKRSWNFIFSDIFSIIGQFDTVFFASPLLGKSPGTLPHCIDKFGKTGISFNDFLL